MTVSTYGNVTVHVHPDHKNDRSVDVEKCGVLTFVNDYEEFPEFEIEFINSAPPCSDDKLTGSMSEPIVLHMPNEATQFAYYIVYKHRDGRCIREILRFARTCGPCP